MRQFWRPLSELDLQPASPERPTKPFSVPFLKGFQGRNIAPLQESFDFAVVMPTTLRPTIADAIRSVFDQRLRPDRRQSPPPRIGQIWLLGDQVRQKASFLARPCNKQSKFGQRTGVRPAHRLYSINYDAEHVLVFDTRWPTRA
jgi:hypothetical protein